MLDTKGKLDPEALKPLYVALSLPGEHTMADLDEKAVRDLGVQLWRPRKKERFRFERSHARHLEYLGLKLPSAAASARAQALRGFYASEPQTVYLLPTSHEAKLLQAATLLAKGEPAVTADGWAFCDGSGRLLLNRLGEIDPKANPPVVEPPPAKPKRRKK